MKHYCRTDTPTVMDVTAAKITPTSQRSVEFRKVGQKGIVINASYPMLEFFIVGDVVDKYQGMEVRGERISTRPKT